MFESSESCAIFNLNGQYLSLEFDVGHIDGSNMRNGWFEIYLDEEYAQTIEVNSDMIVTHIIIPLNYAMQLKIIGMTKYPEYATYGFANAILK